MKFWRSYRSFHLCSLFLFATSFCATAADGFRLDFLWKEGRNEARLSLLRRGPYIRIDQPAMLFSLIYNVDLQSFLGLEHLDAHFWSFDWPTIQANVKHSRENRWRLRSDPFQEDPTLAPFDSSSPPSSSRATVFHDLARFSWIRVPGPESRWIGHDERGEEASILTSIRGEAHRAFLMATAQQIKMFSQIFYFLLAREAWPESALAIWLSLPEDAGVPLEMSWKKNDGGEGKLRLILEQWKEPPAELFTIPKDYQRQTLEEIEAFLH
ncbi:hypothetical protein MAMC_00640 [Methylacidimicrobium cyclopophantes]|uniref:Uncharacterized protein n=1 Tax=Methylacidimicrobium cyclopophantes TaxID=1041766 RepID=A0A5E6M9A1_9BACT|nr:hypothetical protein [Methylacidimicrobium cyclopophantes]VVM05518.1 hypothetical protein MAMC_00640 [Methylacidimicrobium cyclopophantes]